MYDKDHLSGPDDGSSCGNIPCPIAPYKEALESLDHTISFIYDWLQCFEDNYEERIILYKQKIIELFKKIPLSLTPINPDDYKKNIRQLSSQYRGGWFIEKMYSNIPSINIRWLSKKEQNEEDKIKENLRKANDHWNYWKFLLYWD